MVAYSLASWASWEKTVLGFSQSTPPFFLGYPQLLAIASFEPRMINETATLSPICPQMAISTKKTPEDSFPKCLFCVALGPTFAKSKELGN
jgi:hypothetical protein